MNWSIIIENKEMVLNGVFTTLWTVGLSLFIGLFIALITAVMSVSKNPFLRYPAETFSYLFRGTPMLIQLYIFYYGFGLLLSSIDGIQDTMWWSVIKLSWPWAIVTMSLNTAAYTCEIFRGAIKNTNFGEIEAAKSMGMSNAKMLKRIILPSAFRRSLPAYGNEVIYMLHGSAIIFAISINDLTGVAKYLNYKYYDPYVPFLMAAAIYLTITATIVLLFKFLEKRYLSYLKR